MSGRVRSSEFGVRSGFTLVELLIASTMMAVMFVGLTAHLRGGMMVWQRVTSRAETWQERRIALKRVERDFVNAVVYDDQSSSFGADQGQLPYPVFKAQELAYVTRATTGPAAGRLVWVTYACGSRQGQAGFWRAQQLIGEARARQPAPAPEQVLASCEGLSFAYGYKATSEPDAPLEWKAQWPSSAQDPDWMKLPRLALFSFIVEGQQFDYAITIPQGLLKVSQPPTL